MSKEDKKNIICHMSCGGGGMGGGMKLAHRGMARQAVAHRRQSLWHEFVRHMRKLRTRATMCLRPGLSGAAAAFACQSRGARKAGLT